MQGAKKEQELEPLLKDPLQTQSTRAAVPPQLEPVAENRWDGGLLSCFGKCDLPGWATCGLTYVAPCISFGFNAKRAFRQSLLLHAAIFFVLMVASGWMMIGANRAEDALCPHGVFDEASYFANIAGGHRKLLGSLKEANDDGEEGNAFADWARAGEGYDLAKRMHPPPNPVPWAELPEVCQRAIKVKHGLIGWVLLLGVIGVIYCSARRTAIRRKFGIAGSRLGDFCVWCWCPLCALCQETRTLWSNNVHDGVWHGPTELPVTMPPPAQFVTESAMPMSV